MHTLGRIQSNFTKNYGTKLKALGNHTALFL